MGEGGGARGEFGFHPSSPFLGGARVKPFSEGEPSDSPDFSKSCLIEVQTGTERMNRRMAGYRLGGLP